MSVPFPIPAANYLAVNLTFALLYSSAYQRRGVLEFTVREGYSTVGSVLRDLLNGSNAILSTVMAFNSGPQQRPNRSDSTYRYPLSKTFVLAGGFPKSFLPGPTGHSFTYPMMVLLATVAAQDRRP